MTRRHATQLVAEAQAVGLGHQQAAGQRRLDLVQRWRHQHIHQPALGPPGHHGHRVQQRLHARRQPCEACQHNILHGGRHRPARLGGVTQHLGDEEGIAARQRVHAVGAPAHLLRQLLHAAWQQTRQRHAGQRVGRKFTDDAAQRVRGRHFVVAVAHHQQCARACDSVAQELQQIERGLVRPVRVFDDHQHRPRRVAQGLEHGLEQRRARAGQRGKKGRCGAARHVQQGRQRVRGLERIASPPTRRGRAGKLKPRTRQRVRARRWSCRCRPRPPPAPRGRSRNKPATRPAPLRVRSAPPCPGAVRVQPVGETGLNDRRRKRAALNLPAPPATRSRRRCPAPAARWRCRCPAWLACPRCRGCASSAARCGRPA